MQDSVFKRGSPGFRENWEVVPYGGETVLFRRFEPSPPAFASTTLRRRFVASSDKVRKFARRHAVMPVLCNNVATAYFYKFDCHELVQKWAREKKNKKKKLKRILSLPQFGVRPLLEPIAPTIQCKKNNIAALVVFCCVGYDRLDQ